MTKASTNCMPDTNEPGSAPAGRPEEYPGTGAVLNWIHLRARLAAVRGRWDLAVLANLARDATRPGDLLEAIRAQAPQDRQLSWTVLTRTLRRMEDEGYVGHAQVSQLPRVTRYWLTPGGQRLVTWLARMDSIREPGHGLSHRGPLPGGNTRAQMPCVPSQQPGLPA
jgi:DNA-binding HxlR family transcriptional regulator